MDSTVSRTRIVIANTKDVFRRTQLTSALNIYIQAKAKLDLSIQEQQLKNLSVDLSKAQPFDMGNRESETGAFI